MLLYIYIYIYYERSSSPFLFVIVFQLYLHNFSEKCPFRYSEKKTNSLNNAIITKKKKMGKEKSFKLRLFFFNFLFFIKNEKHIHTREWKRVSNIKGTPQLHSKPW